jgi:hypothetical protein
MNLTIEFPDIFLSDIIEKNIRNYLHESSEGYEFLRLYVQRQLREEIVRQVESIDFDPVVREVVRCSLPHFIDQAVEKELTKRLKVAAQRVLAQQDLSVE